MQEQNENTFMQIFKKRRRCAKTREKEKEQKGEPSFPPLMSIHSFPKSNLVLPYFLCIDMHDERTVGWARNTEVRPPKKKKRKPASFAEHE